MIKDKKILITGGGGFIGSHLIDSLASQNDITIYDNFTRNAVQYTETLKKVKTIKGDVLDTGLLDSAVKDADVVIHMAAIAGVPKVLAQPSKVLAVNLIGSQNAINSSLKHGVQRFVLFSTSEVYGSNANEVKETDPTQQGPVTELRWIYAASKLMDEFACHAYFTANGFPYTSLRPFNVYGERQVGEGAIQTFIINALKHEPITITGEGKQIRSWCHVADAVQLINLVLESKKAVGNIFNMGNPSATVDTKQLAGMIINATRSKSKITYKEVDYPEVWVRKPNIDKARKLLGFDPKIGLEEGIKRTIAWFKQNYLK